MRAKLLEIKQQLRRRMHEPIARTGPWLRSIVQGYFNYHAVPGNTDSLSALRYRVIRLWRTMLIHRARNIISPGRGCVNWLIGGFHSRVFSIPTPELALTPCIQDRSPMR